MRENMEKELVTSEDLKQIATAIAQEEADGIWDNITEREIRRLYSIGNEYRDTILSSDSER